MFCFKQLNGEVGESYEHCCAAKFAPVFGNFPVTSKQVKSELMTFAKMAIALTYRWQNGILFYFIVVNQGAYL